jgi:hypothetical protein
MYICVLASNPMVTSPGVVITAASGDHGSSMNHASVQGIRLDGPNTIHYVPHGLNDVFSGLMMIHINDGRVKEVHQRDLQPFSKLRDLDLDRNDITVIERDLFKHNPDLQVIRLSINKIVHVHPSVFDQLNQLVSLSLSSNACVDKFARTDRLAVLEVIKSVKELCLPDDLSEIRMKNAKIDEMRQELVRKSAMVEGYRVYIDEKNQRINELEDINNKGIRKLEAAVMKLGNDLKMQLMKIDQIQLDSKNQQAKSEENDKKFRKFETQINDLMALKEKVTELDIKSRAQPSSLKKFFDFIKNHEPVFFFIVVPMICLLTTLNVVVICMWCKNGSKEKKSQNDVRNVGS